VTGGSGAVAPHPVKLVSWTATDVAAAADVAPIAPPYSATQLSKLLPATDSDAPSATRTAPPTPEAAGFTMPTNWHALTVSFAPEPDTLKRGPPRPRTPGPTNWQSTSVRLAPGLSTAYSGLAAGPETSTDRSSSAAAPAKAGAEESVNLVRPAAGAASTASAPAARGGTLFHERWPAAATDASTEIVTRAPLPAASLACWMHLASEPAVATAAATAARREAAEGGV
jgi:hypothetical protein